MIALWLLQAAVLDGVVLTYWGRYSIDEGIDGIARAQALGAESVTILVHLCQENKTSSTLTYCDERDVPFNESYQYVRLQAMHADLSARGMRFNLMPFVMMGSGEKRQSIWPDDYDAWFASYLAHIEPLAQYAQDAGNASFIAASEMASVYVFDWKWREIFKRLRALYTGHLTVSTLIGTHEAVTFWDALDSIGVSAYFPLAVSKKTRSTWALRVAWEVHQAHLIAYAALWGKPLNFVEVGYPATDIAAVKPWDWDYDARDYDEALQKSCFEAFLQTWHHDRRLVGFQIWGLSNPAFDRNQPKTFAPSGKAAAPVIQRLFADRRSVP